MNILRNLQMSFLGTNGSGKHLFNISPGSLQKPCQISAKIVCSDLARIYTTVISQNLIKSLLTDSTRIRQCFEQWKAKLVSPANSSLGNELKICLEHLEMVLVSF